MQTKQKQIFCGDVILLAQVAERKDANMKYEIIGYERVKGDKSKKTGKPYDMRILHCKDLTPFTKTDDFGGNKVETIVFSLLNAQYDFQQRVLDLDIGDKIHVFYNRSGYPDDFALITE